MSKTARVAVSIGAAVLVALLVLTCLLHTRASYVEYYGDGPPYYGRTTNMDKWEDPLPRLLMFDGIVLGLAAALAYGTARLWRARPGT